MYELSLNENDLSFKSLEKKIYSYSCDFACNMLSEILEQLDVRLMNERDTKVYRSKGKKCTCIKTIMGDIKINRRIYQYKLDGGKKAYKYLLDEFLSFDAIGHMSVNMVESILSNVTDVSYRKTAKNIELMCNQNISHTAVWNVVQKFGEKLKEKEQRKIELNKANKLNGEKEVKVLFQEQDGVWLSIQGKDKPKGSKRKKKELKLGITYEGWKKRSYRRNQYIVENKVICASFQNSRKFKELSDATIAEVYNMDEIETRIVNGDGAKWIKASMGEEGVHYQLDPFHKSQAILRNVQDKKEAHKLMKLFHNGKIKEGFEMITQMLIRDSCDEKKYNKLVKLYNYFAENKEALVPYQLREEIQLPEPPKGLMFRNLGTMEHNICDVLAQRMKGRKMSWSINGADNIAKILAEKFSNRLFDSIDETCHCDITENKFEKIIDVVNTVSKSTKKGRKANIYPVQHCNLPFTGCAITNGRKAIRNIFNDRKSSQLIYR